MVLSFSPNDWERAFHLVNDMTAISPGFAPAFSHLAQLDNLAHIIRPGTRRNQERERGPWRTRVGRWKSTRPTAGPSFISAGH